MEEKINAIIFHIERAQEAYQLYLQGRKYYQALRIYKANQNIYFLINENAHFWIHADKSAIINFLFHLEDWFEQFNLLVTLKSPELKDEFIFDRFENSPAFPKNIIDIIRNV